MNGYQSASRIMLKWVLKNCILRVTLRWAKLPSRVESAGLLACSAGVYFNLGTHDHPGLSVMRPSWMYWDDVGAKDWGRGCGSGSYPSPTPLAIFLLVQPTSPDNFSLAPAHLRYLIQDGGLNTRDQ